MDSKLYNTLSSYIKEILLLNNKRYCNDKYLYGLWFYILGNPGLGGFYVDFMQTLYNNLEIKVPIWCVSHAGHYDIPGVQPLKGNVNWFKWFA